MTHHKNYADDNNNATLILTQNTCDRRTGITKPVRRFLYNVK